MRIAGDYNYEMETLIAYTVDQSLQNNLIQLFAQEPYTVEFKYHFIEFLNAITNRPVLVSLYDIGYLCEDKLDLIPLINRLKPDISLIVISEANSSGSTAKRIHRNRIHYYLRKPLDYQELFIAVNSAFDYNRRQIYARGW